MKLLIIIGVIVGVLGAIVIFGGINYPSDRSFVHVGEFQVSVEEYRTIPTWIGGVAIAAGVVLVVAGVAVGRNHKI